ncbi:hypothetical protein [Streptomyces sp. NBC_00247]|uniref:hypothetical protein n=1 Tax=Streptomyces sp. NBC_00247 TaxID=2975689 RepID=UPI003FA7784E
MNASVRSYRYVGPSGLLAAVRAGGGTSEGGTAGSVPPGASPSPGSGSGPGSRSGCPIASAADFDHWVARCPESELREPFTFVVGGDGTLRLAPRRSEHVACAAGEAVLGAGEIGFTREADGWTVDDVSNRSTGYCPDVSSWPAVVGALDRAGLPRPDGFTHEVVFRRCPGCQEHNIVREDHFVRVFRDGELPAIWNVDPST